MGSFKRKIKINGKDIEYTLKKRKGARSMRLAIYPDGAFVVSAPKWYPMYTINRFLEEKAEWIYEKLKNVDFSELASEKETEKDSYKEQKKFAEVVIKRRIEFFNRVYKFEYKRVSIKNQKTCWGSCSAKKNLNFSYRVATLPEELRDYIVVHELCHLQELNHSHRFWRLVKRAVPDYRVLRNKLKHLSLNSKD